MGLGDTSFILVKTITLERLEKRGYISMSDIYKKLTER